MMSTAFLALMAALAADPPAVAAPARPGHEVSPVTVTATPKAAAPADATVLIGSDADNLHGQDVSIWPAQARAAGITGHVTLTCKIDIHGLAETCRVASEDPPGRGFGAAALALRPTFKLTPKTGPDGPEDAMMNIAINFDAKQTESNLQQVMARAAGLGGMAPEDGSALTNEGVHDVNARNLIVYHNPTVMRRVTMMDSQGWAQAPGFDDFAAAYPPQGGGVEGYAVAHCKADATGGLSRCVVAKETPTGHGFGKAAVALAPRFRVSATVMAQVPKGAPVEVDVPIRFPPASEAKDHTVRAPIWVTGYDLQTLLRDFNPPGAKTVSPGAVVKCQVAPDGSLTGCATELTSPDGIDYDNAAVTLASRLRMNLWSAEAGPVAGGVVHLAIKRDATEPP